ncbi:MAG: phosphoribosylanthranilate isomerase [Candidatus Bathyarchaeota archaeon]
MFVKICGIKSRQALEAAVSGGADAVGFVVGIPSSPRNLTLDEARDLRQEAPDEVKTVLVMVPQSLDEVIHVINYVNPDLVQLHGVEFDASRISVPVIRGVTNKTPHEEVQRIASNCDIILLDSHKEGVHGGTGFPLNLDYSKNFIERIKPHPVILAGGMRPDTVEEATCFARPFGVDVSSGVESSPGVKDPKKIRAFIAAAKRSRQEG